MSDQIKHECGIALIRLLKPLEYYQEKYGTSLYGLNKLNIMMEKQFNRGQDGAGVATIKFDTAPGKRYVSRYRSNSDSPVKDIFGRINSKFEALQKDAPERLKQPQWLKENVSFVGELLLGHLRYGTYGKNSIENCHPFLRQNNWKTRNLVVAGNFNLTNVDELFQQLVELGQHPKEMADTVTVMERIGHFLDVENDRLFKIFKEQGHSNEAISDLIGDALDLQNILTDAARKWDGGYAMAGLLGHGDAFVTRDPQGIRPAFYLQNDEIIAVASERPVLQTVFNASFEDIKEITPGHAIIIKRNGNISELPVRSPKEIKPCSFERIYFSRANDQEIYEERKRLGHLVCDDILKAVNYDLDNTVFSFIPNTAETSFYGMIKGIEEYQKKQQADEILKLGTSLTPEKLHEILGRRPRVEKIALKDAKIRTFIANDVDRDDMVSGAYDITYGTVKKGKDNLVIIDDSIVRGTTLKQSILRILDRLGPKKIVVVSSAPQIRFPDCYGIDMAKMGDFIAFEATITLLKENGKEAFIQEIYEKAKKQILLPKEEIVNVVKELYGQFSYDEVSAKIAQLLTPANQRSEVEIIYQRIDNLHIACPNHPGDWYFSGDYPTPGGNKVAVRAFMNYMEGKNVRAY